MQLAINTSTRPSVVYVHTSSILGGAERSFLDLAPFDFELERVVVPTDGPLARHLRSLGIGQSLEIIEMPNALERLSRSSGLANLVMIPLAALSICRYFLKLKKYIERQQPKLIYSHGIKNHFILTCLAKYLRMPIVWHLQDYWPSSTFARCFLDWAMKGDVSIICNSESVRSNLDPSSQWEKKVRVIHNSIDASAYPLTLDHGNKEKKIIAFLGMLVPWKGPHVFLEAARIVNQELGDYKNQIEFWVIGGTPYRTRAANNSYEESIRRAAPSNVKFLGLIDDPRDLLRQADLLCHTSIRPEPFGRVVLEGMASGAIVIAANDGGPQELIRAGSDGFLHEPGNAKSLALAITNALRLSEPAQLELRRRARAKVEDRFSATIFRSSIASFLKELSQI
jgi:glycosyltransferase involved in cell wall biosynthesis